MTKPRFFVVETIEGRRESQHSGTAIATRDWRIAFCRRERYF